MCEWLHGAHEVPESPGCSTASSRLQESTGFGPRPDCVARMRGGWWLTPTAQAAQPTGCPHQQVPTRPHLLGWITLPMAVRDTPRRHEADSAMT